MSTRPICRVELVNVNAWAIKQNGRIIALRMDRESAEKTVAILQRLADVDYEEDQDPCHGCSGIGDDEGTP